MDRIVRLFEEKKEQNEGVLIPFITAGDPNFEKTIEIGNLLFDAGADILELGIPFSDPIADGPTIQASSQRALENGITPIKVMAIARKLSHRGPLVFMTYYNIPLQYGIERFVVDAKNNGVAGLIIPDLPLEEAQPVMEICKRNKLAFILFVTPTTDEARISQILKKSTGYVYLVSNLAVTGEQKSVANLTKQLVANIQKTARSFNMPISVGFGISSEKHVREIIDAGADGVIIGSAIINKINNDSLKHLSEFVSLMKANTKK